MLKLILIHKVQEQRVVHNVLRDMDILLLQGHLVALFHVLYLSNKTIIGMKLKII